MPSAKTQPPRGMRDFLAEDVRKREYVIGVIKEVYERYGFEPLETPAAENIETLMGKYGEEGNQLIFKILKRGVHEGTGEADLALRYDLTVPLARVVAEYRDKLPKFFRRYQIQPVWRADRPARGRFREFYQCDVDVVGARSILAEIELCSAVTEVLQRLGFVDFIIRLNHRQVLTGMLEFAGVSHESHTNVLVTLDKLDKIGAAAVETELAQKGFSGSKISALLEFLSFSRDDAQRPQYGVGVLHRIANFMNPGGSSRAQAQSDLAMIEHLTAGTPLRQHLRFDPSLARGLSYYTGTMMEISVTDLSGSLGGGGRYDDLVGMFLGRQVPACGFSLGLERILVVMGERGLFPTQLTTSLVNVMVAITTKDLMGLDEIKNSIALATELRGSGLIVELYPEPFDKLDKQLKYASKRGISLVVIEGPDERIRGEVSIKDMGQRTQVSVKRDLLSIELRKAIEKINE